MSFDLFFFSILNILFLIIFFCNAKSVSKLFRLYKKNNNTPLVGGIGIWFFFFNFIIYLYLFYNDLINDHIFLIFCVSLIFLIGVLDDIFELNYLIRLSSIFLILVFFLFYENSFLIKEIYFSSIQITFIMEKSSIILTPFFILLLLNSLNMADGINGNSTIIFILYFLFLFEPKLDLNILVYIVFISLIIFIFFNLKNKIYMGDSGIYLISVIIGLYTIYKYNLKASNISSEEIFLIFMIPGIDMFRLFCKRIYNKKNPFSGDLNHFHHLLIRRFNLKISLSIYSAIIALPNITKNFFEINYLYLIFANIFIYMFLILLLKKKTK
jgi:UDP-GlcNAc:undecaprenyl-phosphate GlcNAc-1-phosphate transferase